MRLFLRLFCALAILSLSACGGSGLVYAPVSDLTKPPRPMKPVRARQHGPRVVSDTQANSLAVPRNASLGQLFVERVEPEKMQSKESPAEASQHPKVKKGEEKTSKPEAVPIPAPRSAQIASAQAVSVHQATPVQTTTTPAAELEEPPEITAPVASKGGWSWPTKGKVVSRFVADSISGNKGVDIQGVLGQPVWAAAAGKVVYSGSGVRGYGHLIIIRHNQNYLSAYAYNQRLLVKEGDNVKGGQAIAEMGKAETGRVLLHFEIRYNGRPVDPLAYLK